MRNLKKPLVVALATITVSLFFTLNSCKKDLIPTKPKTTTSFVTAPSSNEQMVAVPGRGWVPASQVHLIPEGHYLMKQNGHVYEMEKNTRKIMKDFGDIGASQLAPSPNNSLQRNDAHLQQNNLSNPPGQNNWVTWWQWINTTPSNSITSFSAGWKVPSAPFNSTGSQLIYLFNGLTNSDKSELLQPVLQWGTSPAGGGQYWAIANWYIGPNGFSAVQLPLTTVSTGTTISGVMQLTGLKSDNSYNYISYFVGYHDTLTVVEGDTINKKTFPATVIPFVTGLTVATVTLEAYASGQTGVNPPTSVLDYPVDSLVKFTGVSLLQGATYPTFNSGNVTTNNGTYALAGQKTVVANYNNPTGEIDIHFHSPVFAPNISYLGPDRFFVGAQYTLTPTNTGGTATSYSVNPALPAGLSINSTTGVISAAPTTTSLPTNYTVTATNTGGTSHFTVNIATVAAVNFHIASGNTASTSLNLLVDGYTENAPNPLQVSQSSPITFSGSGTSNSTVVIQITGGHIPTAATIYAPQPINGVISGSTITFTGANLTSENPIWIVIN